MYTFHLPLRFIFLIACLLFSFQIVYAQSGFNETASVRLVPDPIFPSPNSPVDISLDAYTIDTTGASISWFVDGEERALDKNARAITVQMGELGESVQVTAKIYRINSPAFSVSITILPTDVDIVLEANTYIPSFYKGRALPSSNAVVRAIAIPHTGSNISPTEYTYEWSYNNSKFSGGPIKGKQSIEFTMPDFYGSTLSVIVFNEEGAAIAYKGISLVSENPDLRFYQENPLRGLDQKSIGSELMLIGEETTIHGEPYYMHSSLSKADTIFEWKVDGVPTNSQNKKPHTLTLRRAGGNGSAGIELTLYNKDPIPQYVSEAFSILFK